MRVWSNDRRTNHLQLFNPTNKPARLVGALDMSKRGLVLFAKEEIGGVLRLLNRAGWDGGCAHTILTPLKLAIQDNYWARGQSDTYFDTAILAIRLGG